MKVVLTKQAGQTGLRVTGTILDVPALKAEAWINAGLAKKVAKPRKKKAKKAE